MVAQGGCAVIICHGICLAAPPQCFFRTDASRPFQSPPCTPEPCSFRIKGMACSDFFAANGNFVREARADGAECEDPFMEGVRRPLMPP